MRSIGVVGIPDLTFPLFRRWWGEAISKHPDFLYKPLNLAYAYSAQERWSEAADQYDTLFATFEDEGEKVQPAVEALAGLAYAKVGQTSRAEAILRQLEERFAAGSAEDYVPADYIGVLYIGLGEHDVGMNWLQKAYENGEQGLLFLTSWMYRDVKSHPVYQDLLRRVFGERLGD